MYKYTVSCPNQNINNIKIFNSVIICKQNYVPTSGINEKRYTIYEINYLVIQCEPTQFFLHQLLNQQYIKALSTPVNAFPALD